MTLDELRRHPAWQGLTDSERGALEALILGGGVGAGLDDTAASMLEGGVDSLDADDLRACLLLSLNGRRGWLRPSPAPTVAAALATALARAAEAAGTPLDAEGTRRVTAFARACAAASLDTESLVVLRAGAHRLALLAAGLNDDVVEAALGEAGLERLRDALAELRAETEGVRGLLSRVGRWFETGARDLAHGVRFAWSGQPEHEGRYTPADATWRSWNREVEVHPARFARPRTEAELATLVAGAERVRVVGGGHGFNASPKTDGLLISLDDMNAIVALDPVAGTARVQAGLRLRDLNQALWQRGFALSLLGSTDVQSVGGVLASDVHGTGRDHGFVSEQVRRLRVMAADGSARWVGPDDDVFRAVCGGLGTCGIVTEVEAEIVPAYHLEKATRMVDRVEAEADVEARLNDHRHLSFYYVGGAEPVVSTRQHTWNRTEAPLTPNWASHKAVAELQDFGIAAFVPAVADLLAEVDEDALISDMLAPDKALVMPSSVGFGRKLFYLHDEIEYGVPLEVWRPCVDRVLRLLAHRRQFSIVEVRFTPDQSRSLLGGGVGRRTAWIELATPLAEPRDDLFAEFEALMRAYDGQPHLGKRTQVDAAELARLHGDRFARFQAVRQAQDPSGKFLNAFTRRMFVPA